MAANVLTVGDITKGKIVATDLLRTFITYLVQMLNVVILCLKIERLIQYISEFCVYYKDRKKRNQNKICKQEWLSKVLLTGSKKAVEDIVSVTMSLKKLKQNIYMLLLKKMY